MSGGGNNSQSLGSSMMGSRAKTAAHAMWKEGRSSDYIKTQVRLIRATETVMGTVNEPVDARTVADWIMGWERAKEIRDRSPGK